MAHFAARDNVTTTERTMTTTNSIGRGEMIVSLNKIGFYAVTVRRLKYFHLQSSQTS